MMNFFFTQCPCGQYNEKQYEGRCANQTREAILAAEVLWSKISVPGYLVGRRGFLLANVQRILCADGWFHKYPGRLVPMIGRACFCSHCVVCCGLNQVCQGFCMELDDSLALVSKTYQRQDRQPLQYYTDSSPSTSSSSISSTPHIKINGKSVTP